MTCVTNCKAIELDNVKCIMQKQRWMWSNKLSRIKRYPKDENDEWECGHW